MQLFELAIETKRFHDRVVSTVSSGLSKDFRSISWKGVVIAMELGKVERIGLKDLGERVGSSKQALGQSLRWFTQLGLIQSEQNIEDRRSMVIELTKKGRRFHAQLIQVLQDLDSDEGLEKLIKRMSKRI